MLFTCQPLAGHFEPLVSLARAAKASGHVVAFATGEPYASRARQAGFEAFRAGPGEDFRTEWAPRFPGFDRLVGDAQRHFFLTEIFAHIELAPSADDLEIIVENWRPQLLVHEVAELAAPLVGSAHGLAYVDVSYPMPPRWHSATASDPTAPSGRAMPSRRSLATNRTDELTRRDTAVLAQPVERRRGELPSLVEEQDTTVR